VQLGLKDPQVSEVRVEMLDNLAHEGLQGPTVCLVCVDPMEVEDHKELKDLPDLPEVLEALERLVSQVPVDHQDSADNQVSLDSQDRLELPGQMVIRDLRGLLVSQEVWADPESKDKQDVKETRAREDLADRSVHQVCSFSYCFFFCWYCIE